MIAALKGRWQQFRSRFWLSLFFDVAVIIALMLSVHAWQTRNLPYDEPAPETVLALLDGSGIRSAVQPGEAGVIYFFAPWCIYCETSIDNLQSLVDGGRIAWGTAIALDYSSVVEVEQFVQDTEFTLPVLMGNDRTLRDWGIRGYPTYYVIDGAGRISSRSVGYSTYLGMWARAFKAGLARDDADGPR